MVKSRIFISHSAKELDTSEFLEKLYEKLKEDSAFDVLVDRERLIPGCKWRDEIYTWMGLCHGAVILLTKNLLSDKSYIFGWDDIPVNAEKLIYFLNQRFGLEWIKTAKIEKIDSNSIKISNVSNNISLVLNNEKSRVNLIIDDGRNYNFISKTGDNGKIEIYELGSIWVPRETSILLWRKTLDPNFIIIPVYLGIEPGDLKEQTSFNDLNLPEVHGYQTKNKSHDEIIDSIKLDFMKQLKPNNASSPLDDIADIIAEDLKMVPDNTIEKASALLDINLGPWEPMNNPKYKLALAMIHAGLRKSIDAMEKLKDSQKNINIDRIFGLIEPSWVDICAARLIADCAMKHESKRAVILNASEFYSARMYVRRASCRPPKSWVILEMVITGIGVDAMIAEVEITLIKKLLTESDPSKAKIKLTKLLKNMSKERKPVFVVLKYSKEISEYLPKLQKAFPCITFFLITGDNLPKQPELNGLYFQYLEPQLPSGIEEKVLEDFDLAHVAIYAGNS